MMKPIPNTVAKRNENLVGLKKNRLLVVSWKRTNGLSFLICKCDCGNTKILRRDHWTEGRTKSCGCYNLERVSKPLGVSPLRRAIASYAAGAVNRGLVFGLNENEFSGLVFSNCFYCGSEPTRKVTAGRIKGNKRPENFILINGIDRKDNKLGYSIENCLPCCFSCNRAKGSKTFDNFLTWLRMVAEHQGIKND